MNPIDDDAERLRKAKRCRNLKRGASVRNIAHRTFELWRLLKGLPLMMAGASRDEAARGLRCF